MPNSYSSRTPWLCHDGRADCLVISRVAVDTLALLLHPVRLRIVHAMSGGRILTIFGLCARLPDVPKTTARRTPLPAAPRARGDRRRCGRVDVTG
jgi:hypothetical protein